MLNLDGKSYLIFFCLADEDEVTTVPTAQSLGVRAQKKLLG